MYKCALGFYFCTRKCKAPELGLQKPVTGRCTFDAVAWRTLFFPATKKEQGRTIYHFVVCAFSKGALRHNSNFVVSYAVLQAWQAPRLAVHFVTTNQLERGAPRYPVSQCLGKKNFGRSRTRRAKLFLATRRLGHLLTVPRTMSKGYFSHGFAEITLD